MKKFIAQLILLSSLLTLTACGFHLAGKESMPTEFSDIYLKYKSADAQIALSLQRFLKTNGVQFVTDPEKAKYILNIVSTQENNNLQGSGNIQETRRYTLISALTYLVSDTKGQTVYGPVSVSSSSSLYVYSGQVIGNNQETVSIFQSLRQQNIQKVLLTLSSKNAFSAFTTSDDHLTDQAAHEN